MQSITFVNTFLSLSFLLLPAFASGNLTGITVSPTVTPGACVTITSTNGPSCPTPSGSPCAVLDCIFLNTVTQSCGCASIYTATVCESTCPTGCGTTYVTLRMPCTTGPSGSPTSTSTSSTPTDTVTSTSSTSSSSTDSSGTISRTRTHTSYSHTYNGTETPTCPGTETATDPPRTVTITTITTITSCPAKVTCHGQTSTWTGNNGPFPCDDKEDKKTCSCVLPGGGNTTITGTGTVTGSTTATTTKVPTGTNSPLPANGGNVGMVASIEGLLFGLLGFVVGFL